MKILMTGATGFIGKEMGIALAKKGHELIVLSRDVAMAKMHLPFPCTIYEWRRHMSSDACKGIQAVVHLAGEPVAGRWTSDKKRKIRDSRIHNTHTLFRYLTANKAHHQLTHVVAASAVGFYGDRGGQILTEESDQGQGFLSQVCVDWEKATQEGSESLGARYIGIRTGMVLGTQGGALKEMLPLFQRGLGGVLGDGTQYMSWIHLQDLVRMYVSMIENSEAQGVFNGVAPHPVSNSQFTSELCQALGVSKGFSVPAFVLKAMLGEVSVLALSSQNAIPQKAMEKDFIFEYPTLEEALRNLFRGQNPGEKTFISKQWIPMSLSKTFDSFKQPSQMKIFLPSWVDVKNLPVPIVEGYSTSYELKIKGASVHHLQTFETLGRGTLMTDRLVYRPPLGVAGHWLATPLIDRDLKAFTEHRRQVIFDRFCR
ncbi:MAG: TIGR01777 family oxidoreductase [Bdellovibrionales bacterium]